MHYKYSISSPFLCLYSTVSHLDMLYIFLLVLLLIPGFHNGWKIPRLSPRVLVSQQLILGSCEIFRCWLIRFGIMTLLKTIILPHSQPRCRQLFAIQHSRLISRRNTRIFNNKSVRISGSYSQE